MPVRTKRLAEGDSAPEDTPQVVYTCPASETTIVKDIHLFGQSGGASRAAVQLSSGSDWRSVADGAIAALEVVSIQCWIVLQPGDQIRVYSEDGFFEFWISGTQLEGVAD